MENKEDEEQGEFDNEYGTINLHMGQMEEERENYKKKREEKIQECQTYFFRWWSKLSELMRR